MLRRVCYVNQCWVSLSLNPTYNYGIHDRLGDDGITQWHPAFLAFGKTLDACAAAYRKFCKQYRPKPKSESKNHWGNRLLAGLKVKGKPKQAARGQLCLPWGELEVSGEVIEVAEKFIFANCYNPQIAGQILQKTTKNEPETDEVPGIGNVEQAWLRSSQVLIKICNA